MDATEVAGVDERSGGINTVSTTPGVSPYATGGGGFAFEWRAAAVYLSRLLVGAGAPEFGEGRCVVSVALQQAPEFPIDDLVVSAALPDESEPSLLFSVAVRRAPRIVSSDKDTRKLVRNLVRAVMTSPTEGPERRWGLLVSGPQNHAKQLKKLADHATVQMDAPGFFELIRTPRKFEAGIRGRLDQIESLVKSALVDLGPDQPDGLAVQQTVWRMLSRLTVLMPRLESDESDWGEVANSLIPVARSGDLPGASQLRDRLAVLAADYAPKAARVNRSILRRDVHALLDTTERSYRQGWQALEHLHSRVLSSVRDEVTSGDGVRRLRLDRCAAVAELREAVEEAGATLLTGESGVGKSALALLPLTAAANADPETLQVLGVNLRHVPSLTVEFERTLGSPLSTLLSELSAPQRVLVVDGADAVNEGREDAFRYLVDAAHDSDVKVIAVTTLESQQVIRDIVTSRFGTEVRAFIVGLLTDDELADVVGTFTELADLSANPRSRELLRRLVVVDLLVRGGVSGVPLNDADAMDQVWSGLVRRPGATDRGSPEERELVFLRLADLELRHANSLEHVGSMDTGVLDGLRRDGLLRASADDPFLIGPEFAHDELRRYATARLLLTEHDLTSKLTEAGGPRWALGAARLACQALLALPDLVGRPLRGRFAALQAAFESLAGEGYSPRWGDVPTEALLRLSDPGPVLRDAWPTLHASDGAGLRRLARLVDQQLRDDQGMVRSADIEPIVKLLLEDAAPWWSGDHAQQLLRDWLRGHLVAETPAGHELRARLRERLVSACAEADRRLAEQREAEAARRASQPQDEQEGLRRVMEQTMPLFTETGFGGRRRRDRPEVPREITDEIVIELLALLGPDLGEDGEGILLRVARDAPWQLAPAVERFFAGRALAKYRRGVLALLTEAYYFDDEATGGDILDDGIRRHEYLGVGIPQAAWIRGPFMPLFETDFLNGVGVVNRLLNHASLIRARTLAGPNERNPTSSDPPDEFAHSLEVTGSRSTYVGDDHVWIWYRGTGVGPYPCISALQALERFCDHVVAAGVSLRFVVPVLLNGCESLAMVGLVVGLLVRHIDKAEQLLDPCFTEPLIWELEFNRVTQETSPLAAHTDGLAALERRKWSLRDAAMYMGANADTERAAQLRSLGKTLVTKARSHLESGLDEEATAREAIEQQLATVRLWASSLDPESYQVWEAHEGVYIQASPPEEVVEALKPDAEESERFQQEMRLYNRYYFEPQRGGPQAIGPEELAADLSAAQRLLEEPSSCGAYGRWDVPALVAATSLEAHILYGVELPEDALAFATDTVLRVGEGEAWPRPFESEVSLFEQGADRSAARALPLLLLPAAAPLLAAIDAAEDDVYSARISAACLNLARAVSCEVRLHLARALDHVWETPCSDDSRCHHEAGLRFTIETMRDCVLGDWTPDGQRRRFVVLDEPVGEALAGTPDNLVFFPRLDAAIRSLAPAAMANICVSTQARGLVTILLAAQRRSLLSYEQLIDERSTHSLVGARALLALAEHGDDKALHKHLDAYADNSELLGKLLRALSAAAEEAPRRAATASRIWPKVIRHVLNLDNAGHTPFRGHHFGDLTRAALIPNPTYETAYLYRELQDTPIVWWKPLTWKPEVQAWLEDAKGKPQCVDQLVAFVGSLEPEDQASTALPWVATLVLADPARIARRTYYLPDWLIELRTAAVAADLIDLWQRVVDALVVKGDTQLAPYSE